MKHKDRSQQDATMRQIFFNHRLRHTRLHNKLERNAHYALGLELGYKDVLAGNQAHRDRYSDTFFRAGYQEAMRRWNNLDRVIGDFQLRLMPRDTRPANYSRRKWRKMTRRETHS